MHYTNSYSRSYSNINMKLSSLKQIFKSKQTKRKNKDKKIEVIISFIPFELCFVTNLLYLDPNKIFVTKKIAFMLACSLWSFNSFDDLFGA